MKRIVLAIMLIVSALNYLQAQTVTVPVQIQEDFSSRGKKDGTMTAIVPYNVMYNGEILISQGSVVNINYEVEKRRGYGRPAEVKLHFMSTSGVKGQMIPLSGCDITKEGDGRRGTALGLGLGLGLTIFPFVGFFFFCIKGKNVTIPAGTIVNCMGYVNQ